MAQTGNLDQAEVASFHKAIPNQSQRLSELTHTLVSHYPDRGKHDEAVTAFRQAIRLKPKDARTQVTLGYALAQTGKLDEAISRVPRKGTSAWKPTNAKAYFYLGDRIAGSRKVRRCHRRLSPGYPARARGCPESLLSWLRARRCREKLDDAMRRLSRRPSALNPKTLNRTTTSLTRSCHGKARTTRRRCLPPCHTTQA